MTFPYLLPELDLSAPLDRYRTVVRPEWIDLYHHMNMAAYLTVFDTAAHVLCDLLGAGPIYTQHQRGMLLLLDTHLTYERVLSLCLPVRIASQILDRDAKLLPLFPRM